MTSPDPWRTEKAVADLLHRTRTERGLPLTIDDPATIARVAAIVAGEGGGARAVA
jgi:hypothetical protein